MENYRKGILISQLLAKRLIDGIDGAEAALLEELTGEFPEGGKLRSFTVDSEKLKAKASAYDSFQSDKVWSNLESTISQKSVQQNNNKSIRPKRRLTPTRLLKYAAVILIPVSILLVARNLRPERPLTELSHIVLDSNQTTLMLPSGRAIMLDTMHNLIMQQLLGEGLKADDNMQLDYSAGNLSPNTAAQYHTIKVPRGKDYHLTLADGTQVWLFADSEIKFPSVFRGGMRLVELSGEAFFDVTPNRENPFVVRTENCDVRVLGTGFNVKAYNDMETVETSLVWGSVEVNGNLLEPDQQLMLDKASGSVNYQTINGANYVMRTRNMFVFENMGLEEIMRELRRWYDIEVVFTDKELSGKRFGLKVKRDEGLDFILNLFQLTGEVSFRHEGNTVYVRNN